jgi:hypothetical protein
MQLALFKEKKSYGGAARGRKRARVFTTKQAMHFTLKARRYIQHERRYILGELDRLAARFGLQIYEHAVNKDHLHVKLRARSRESYRKFIRAFCGLLARKMGKGLRKHLPFGRPIAWGKDFRRVTEYILVNQLEVFGLVTRRERIPFWRRSGARLSFQEDWVVVFSG